MYIDLRRAVAASSVLAALDPLALVNIINATVAAAENTCGRKFTRGTYTDVFDGNNDRLLMVRTVPLVSITTIDITDDGEVVTSYAGDKFRFDVETGEIRWKPTEGSWFPRGFQNISVTYVGGYDPLPADLQSAIIQGAAFFIGEEQDPAGIIKEKLGDYEVTYAFDPRSMSMWPPTARALLSSYIERVSW